MSDYRAWCIEQDIHFIEEVHGTKSIPQVFKDHEFKPITLEELEDLDNKYILETAEQS